MKKAFLIVVTVFASTFGFSQDENYQLQLDSIEKSFTYEHGTVTLRNGIGNIEIPAGFKYLEPVQAEKVLVDLWGNPPSANITLGLILPEHQGILSDSGYVFNVQYDEIGYVKDDDADEIDYDELLTKIYLPRSGRTLKQYARKVGTRKAQAISKVCFNAAAEMQSGVIKFVRVGLGSVAPVPLRCHKLEETLAGQTLNAALVAHAREVIAKEIQPIDDIRSTSQYRLRVTQNLLGEFLGQLL